MMSDDDRRCAVDDCSMPYSSKGYCAMHAERVRRNGHAERAARPRKSLADRLWAKVDRSGGPDACWPWTGPVSKEGYGSIREGGSGAPMVRVHRAAYSLAHPDEPTPEVLDHRCHDPRMCEGGPDCPHRRCCNPAHVAPSTFVENSAADRQVTRRRLTHCKRDHEFTPENTAWVSSGRGGIGRRCRLCDAERARARRAAA